MAYNYYSDLKLLTTQAAIAPSSTSSSYAYPRVTPFNMKLSTGGFLGTNDAASIPTFVTPYTSTSYGYWGYWTKYKVAENKFYYKSSSSDYVAYKFVEKASAPFLTASAAAETAYTPFKVYKYQNSTSSSFPTLCYWKFSWESTANKIAIKGYTSYTNFAGDKADYSGLMEGYGCFILLSGGGGGGGGADVGHWLSSPGGGGGGGGATALVYIDLFALYKEYPYGFILISLGKGGTGGKGGAGGTGGANGGPSVIYCCKDKRSEENSEYINYTSCMGGSGGSWCAWDKSSTGGNGGSVVTWGSSKDYIKLLTSISGGNGGTNSSYGADVTSSTYSIPFTTTWKAPTIITINSTNYNIGYSVGANRTGGGCAMAIGGQNTNGSGGDGGATNSNGKDGIAGGIAILKNTLLSY